MESSVPLCDWCSKIQKTVKSAAGKKHGAILGAIRPMTNDWSLLLRTWFAIRLEGSQVTSVVLSERFVVFKQIFEPNAAPSSAASSSAPSAASSSSAATSSSIGTNLSAASGGPFATPTKSSAQRMPAVIANVAPAQPHPDLGDDQVKNEEGDQPTDSVTTPRALRTPGSATEAGDMDDDDDSIADEHDLVADPGLPPLSVEGKFPTGRLGQSLTRMRGTVNEYIGTLQNYEWMKSVKPATAKATERRITALPDVETSMHLPMIAAYKALLFRVRAYYRLYKAIKHWKFSENDASLDKVLALMNALRPIMDHFGWNLAPDLAVLRARAIYQETWSKTGLVMKVAYWGFRAKGRMPVPCCDGVRLEGPRSQIRLTSIHDLSSRAVSGSAFFMRCGSGGTALSRYPP